MVLSELHELIGHMKPEHDLRRTQIAILVMLAILANGMPVPARALRLDTQTVAEPVGSPVQGPPVKHKSRPKSQPRSRVSAEQAALAPVEVRWQSNRFVYEAGGRAVTEVLRDFAAAQGLPVVIAEGVDGRVQGQFDTEPAKFLEALARSFSLIWYHDGSALYVYPSKMMQSRIFRLQGFSVRQLAELQAQLRVADPRYPARFSQEDGTLMVNGPPRYIDIISQLVESLDVVAVSRMRQAVEVVSLRHASAADRSLGQARIPGIVSTLRSMFTGQDTAGLAGSMTYPPMGGSPGSQAGGQASPLTPLDKPNPAVQLQEQWLQTQRNASLGDILQGKTPGRADDLLGTGASKSARLQASPLDKADKPVFLSAPVGNAVVIVADALRMPTYIAAVRKLDIEPVLVELEVTIIEVGSDDLETLGVSWSAIVGSRWQSGETMPNDVNANMAGLLVRLGLGGASNRVSVILKALSQTGRAKVTSQSKVVALSDQIAALGEIRKAMIRVTSYQDAKLYPVESGTKIQVTPRVDTQASGTRIHMVLDIEDGGFESAQVDGIPVSRQTHITTEARVWEGESVLLAGLSSNRSGRIDSGVPVLSSIPVLGALFRTSETSSEKKERIFLITPRILPQGAPLMAAADRSQSAVSPALPVALPAGAGPAATLPAASAAPSASSAAATLVDSPVTPSAARGLAEKP